MNTNSRGTSSVRRHLWERLQPRLSTPRSRLKPLPQVAQQPRLPSRPGLAWTARALVVAAAALLCGPVAALSTDRDKPINIEADSAEADERKRVTIYRGDAIITQGTLSIRGQTIWIYLSADDEFIKLVSVGSPARMRQLPDGEEQYLTADANRLEYLAREDRIVLIGDAVYGRGEDRVMAQRIEYDSKRGKMLAGATAAADQETPTKPGRVRIQIKPKKRNN